MGGSFTLRGLKRPQEEVMLTLSSERMKGPLLPSSVKGHMPLGEVDRRAEARIKSEKGGKCWVVLSFGIQGLKFGFYSK